MVYTNRNRNRDNIYDYYDTLHPTVPDDTLHLTVPDDIKRDQLRTYIITLCKKQTNISKIKITLTLVFNTEALNIALETLHNIGKKITHIT